MCHNASWNLLPTYYQATPFSISPGWEAAIIFLIIYPAVGFSDMEVLPRTSYPQFSSAYVLEDAAVFFFVHDPRRVRLFSRG